MCKCKPVELYGISASEQSLTARTVCIMLKQEPTCIHLAVLKLYKYFSLLLLFLICCQICWYVHKQGLDEETDNQIISECSSLCSLPLQTSFNVQQKLQTDEIKKCEI